MSNTTIKIQQTNQLPAGYKQTPIGLIPEEWEIKELGEVTNYIKGYAFKSNMFSDKGVRIIRISDTTSNSIKEEGAMYIDSKNAFNYKKWELKSDDLVFTTVGSRPPMYDSMVGKVIKIEKKHEGSLLNQNAVIIRTKDIANQQFVFNQFKEKRYLDFIETIVRGNANQVSITLEDLFKYPLVFPPLPEQQKIAEILSTWDNAIDNCKKIIKKLKKRNRGLGEQLLSGKKRLKGFEGEAKNEFHVLGNYINEVTVKNKELKVKRVLSVTNSRGFINQSDQFEREVASADVSNYKIVKKGQFAYNPSRVNVGSLDLLRNFDDGILSPMYVVFETNEKKLLPDFLYYQLKTYWFKGHIPMFVQGSVRDSLSFDGLSGMKFFIPSLEEQHAITNIMDSATNELKQYEQKLETLQLQKKGLMQQLLTGKVRVKLNK